MDRKKVLVIYGKNARIKGEIFAFLQKIGLYPFELKNQTKSISRGSSYPGEGLQAVFKDACAVLVLLTGDDEAKPKDQRYVSENDREDEERPYSQPRLNVLFEAGMAFAKRPNNTILVKLGNLRICSDLSDRRFIELNNEQRYELIKMLCSIGCTVDLSKHEWADTGDFDEPDIREDLA